jgi:hypothetical protein
LLLHFVVTRQKQSFVSIDSNELPSIPLFIKKGKIQAFVNQ